MALGIGAAMGIGGSLLGALGGKEKTIPASAVYQAYENELLPAGRDVYSQLKSTPMSVLQEPTDMFGNQDLYALQQARGEAVMPMGYLAGLTDPQKAAIEQMSLGTAGFQDPFTSDLFNQYMQKYQNPYQEQVIDPTLANIREQSDIARSRLGEAATAAGGFGGTRQALENALLEGQTQKNIAETGANLRSQGFNMAADRSMQDYLAGQGIYQQGIQSQLGAGNILQQQNQAGLDVARGFQTAPVEWYQNFLNKFPQTMVTPEQKTQESGLLGKIGGGLMMGSSLFGGGGSGGLSSLFGGSSSSSNFIPTPVMKPSWGY